MNDNCNDNSNDIDIVNVGKQAGKSQKRQGDFLSAPPKKKQKLSAKAKKIQEAGQARGQSKLNFFISKNHQKQPHVPKQSKPIPRAQLPLACNSKNNDNKNNVVSNFRGNNDNAKKANKVQHESNQNNNQNKQKKQNNSNIIIKTYPGPYHSTYKDEKNLSTSKTKRFIKFKDSSEWTSLHTSSFLYNPDKDNWKQTVQKIESQQGPFQYIQKSDIDCKEENGFTLHCWVCKQWYDAEKSKRHSTLPKRSKLCWIEGVKYDSSMMRKDKLKEHNDMIY